MTKQELELKAKEFDSSLSKHPMSSEELQKVLCDFYELLTPKKTTIFCDNHRADLEHFMQYSESICKNCKQKV